VSAVCVSLCACVCVSGVFPASLTNQNHSPFYCIAAVTGTSRLERRKHTRHFEDTDLEDAINSGQSDSLLQSKYDLPPAALCSHVCHTASEMLEQMHSKYLPKLQAATLSASSASTSEIDSRKDTGPQFTMHALSRTAGTSGGSESLVVPNQRIPPFACLNASALLAMGIVLQEIAKDTLSPLVHDTQFYDPS
jgi:hypothetical protein